MIKISPAKQTVEIDKPQKLSRDEIAQILKVLDNRPPDEWETRMEKGMNESTGWPGGEFPENAGDDAYNHHANVKLNQEQLDYIYDSGEPISQWIRDAIQARIDTEAHYKRANERAHGNTVRTHGDTESQRGDGEPSAARE